MTEQELTEIEERCEEAAQMYSDEAMKSFGQRFPCADCIFWTIDIPNLIAEICRLRIENDELRGKF